MNKMIVMMMAAGMTLGALADVSFSYSGQLRDEAGAALPAEKRSPTIRFTLYTAQTGGSAVWGREIAVQLDADGYFAVELSNGIGTAVGTEVALEKVLSDNPTLYVGLFVIGSSGEIAPRQKLVAAPRAAIADDVKKAKNGFTVSGTATFENGLKIGTTGVAEIKSDGEIVAKKLSVPSVSGDVSFGNGLSAKTVTASGKVSAATIDAASVMQGGNVLVPKGVIVMWSGAVTAVPAGWTLCNGSNGAPDLRDRFIVGAGSSYAVGTKGGASTVTLSAAQMPGHNHNVQANQKWDRIGVDLDKSEVFLSVPNYEYKYGTTEGYIKSEAGSFGFNVTSGNAGGNAAHENRPPYYALAYIMKL